MGSVARTPRGVARIDLGRRTGAAFLVHPGRARARREQIRTKGNARRRSALEGRGGSLVSTLIVVAMIVAVLVLLGVAVAAYSAAWETVWKGHHIRVVNRATREELWIDGKLVQKQTSNWLAMQSTLEWTLDDPDHGMVPLRAHIHLNNGASVACDLTIGGVVVPMVAGGAMPPAAEPQERAPADPRWEAASKLLARVRADAGDDQRLVAVAADVQRALRRTLLALDHVAEAMAAHTVLGGDGDGLDAVRLRWEARADALVAAVRDLHLAVISRDGAVDPLATDAVEELLARLKAEAEVDAVAIVAQGAARLPREPVADPERPRTPTTQRT